VLATCAAMGLLLRVSYELDRAQRQVARLRGDATPPPADDRPTVPATAQPLPAAARSAAAAKSGGRGTSRLRGRVEPNLGRSS
jgi:cell division protein FtsW